MRTVLDIARMHRNLALDAAEQAIADLEAVKEQALAEIAALRARLAEHEKPDAPPGEDVP